ncbi:heme exporter protein CcmD [Methylobrevis albus]|uniref:Heme exporter protein D n=1 Tax=Methylobrevis albus TaxID=2793297 RepID=A0A931HZY8_9HYPH|nr:heme exporter protein CcmD [Methylobrevis albus]MBH0237827.1 heme exporter protein CcmD [Methylobrevis albus]
MTGLLGPHAGFILASYAITLAVIAGLILWVRADHRAQRARLAELEARGVRRRSAAARGEAAAATATAAPEPRP